MNDYEKGYEDGMDDAVHGSGFATLVIAAASAVVGAGITALAVWIF